MEFLEMVKKVNETIVSDGGEMLKININKKVVIYTNYKGETVVHYYSFINNEISLHNGSYLNNFKYGYSEFLTRINKK